MTIVIASLPDAGRSLLSRRGTPTPRAIAFHGNDKSQHSTGRTYVNYRTYAQVTESLTAPGAEDTEKSEFERYFA
ncbi:hypothetical protein [Nostoc sp.]|uniref:hypothetical protein n=2 Tax=Nostoc TaxID=1177 RepID=UPI002FF459EC